MLAKSKHLLLRAWQGALDVVLPDDGCVSMHVALQ